MIKGVGRSELNDLSEVDWTNERFCIKLSITRSEQCCRWMGSMWRIACVHLNLRTVLQDDGGITWFSCMSVQKIYALKGMCIFPVPCKAGRMCIRMKYVCIIWDVHYGAFWLLFAHVILHWWTDKKLPIFHASYYMFLYTWILSIGQHGTNCWLSMQQGSGFCLKWCLALSA